MQRRKDINENRLDLNAFSRNRLYLFGLAAFSIVAFHYSYDVQKALGLGQIAMSDNLCYPIFYAYFLFVRSVGVEIFLFLSGMGLYYSYSKDPDPKRFLHKRMVKIWVPYTICAAPYWIIRDVFLRGEPWIRVPEDFFFITFLTEGQHMIWFVFFIFVMYLLYPWFYKILFQTEHETRNFLLLFAASIAIPVAYSLVAHEAFVLTNIATLRIPIFVIGCWMGKKIKDHRDIPVWSVFALAAFCTVFRVLTWHSESAIQARYSAGVFSLGVMVLLVYLMDRYEAHRNKISAPDGPLMRLFRWAGGYSLEIYLAHVCIRNIFKNLDLNTHEPLVYLGIVVLAIPAAVLIGKLSARVHL